MHDGKYYFRSSAHTHPFPLCFASSFLRHTFHQRFTACLATVAAAPATGSRFVSVCVCVCVCVGRCRRRQRVVLTAEPVLSLLVSHLTRTGTRTKEADKMTSHTHTQYVSAWEERDTHSHGASSTNASKRSELDDDASDEREESVCVQSLVSCDAVDVSLSLLCLSDVQAAAAAALPFTDSPLPLRSPARIVVVQWHDVACVVSASVPGHLTVLGP